MGTVVPQATLAIVVSQGTPVILGSVAIVVIQGHQGHLAIVVIPAILEQVALQVILVTLE